MRALYSIKDTDRFDAQEHTSAVREIDLLQTSLRHIQSADKTSILISWLKDHSITTGLLQKNRELVTLITSGALSTSEVEALFSSYRTNAKFVAGLETYIAMKIG